MFAKPKEKANREKQKSDRQCHYERPPSPVADDHIGKLGCQTETSWNAESRVPLAANPYAGGASKESQVFGSQRGN
jgi:hypothetical protein